MGTYNLTTGNDVWEALQQAGIQDDSTIPFSNNEINALAGNDLVVSGEGNDLLSGDLGNDILTGGSGADMFQLLNNSGSDVITDFSAGDILRIVADINGTGLDSFTALQDRFTTDNGDLTIDLGDGNTTVLTGVTDSVLNDNNVEFF